MTEPRKRICTRSVEMSESSHGDDESLFAEAVLRSTLEELKKMREKRAVYLRQEELATLLRQCDEELQRLRETQLSLFNNIPLSNGVSLTKNPRFELGPQIELEHL